MTTPDLRIKEGVIFRPGHLLNHIIAIIETALQTAPITTDGAIWITEGYRNIRDTIDFHELVAAFDFRCRNIVAESQAQKEELGHIWADRMKKKLGEDYDVVAHGIGDSFHVHAEYDPRK